MGGDESLKPGLNAFLAAVSERYDDLESNVSHISHTLEVTSQELTDANEKIRKDSQSELKRLSNFFEQTLDLQPNLIFRANKRGNDFVLTLCRGRLLELAGGFEGKQAACIFPEPAQPVVAASFEAAWRGEPQTFEFKSGNGELSYVTILHPLTGNEGVMEIIGFTANITEIKSAEQELRKSETRLREAYEDLEKRTSELELNRQVMLSMMEDIESSRVELQREMERANELAKAADVAAKAKSDFLAVMSHEIRTPMNGVIGFTNLLMDTQMDKQQQEFVENILTCADSLLVLINDILDFSKIESSNLEIEDEPFNLRQCIENALGVCAHTAAKKHLELVCDFDEKVSEWVSGDTTRLRQVMVNLVGNAVKFTSNGEVVVNVAPGGEESGKNAITIRVRDTGIGIDPDRLVKLFQPFSQADASTTRRYGGTGLGLAISKRLVDAMGGRIQVESKPGHGSTFQSTIQLPPVASKPEQEVKTSLEGVRVLLVDDNKANLMALHHQLRRWQMRTFEAESGAAALAMLSESEPFDLVLLDRMMPEMDGLELARRIRSFSNSKKLPIILLSSVGVTDSLMRSKAAGIQATLNKPARNSQLHDAILRTLWDSGRATKPEPTVKPGSPSGTLPVPLGRDYPLRILMAEDFPVNQRITSLILKKIGYHADIVTNGREAVDAVKAGNYDLLLMDLQMPEMDGLEASREIRRLEAAAGKQTGIYIIALTADAMADDREKCMSAGMDDYLTKPLSFQALQAALQQFVQK